MASNTPRFRKGATVIICRAGLPGLPLETVCLIDSVVRGSKASGYAHRYNVTRTDGAFSAWCYESDISEA